MADTGSSDSFTETTRTSWIERIKNAIGGVIVGAVLVLAACVALFWNEGRAVQTARSLAEGGGLVTSVDANRIDPANEGKLVHVSGAVKNATPLIDPEFGVSTNGIRLVRTVEMYQWREERKTETRKTMGGAEETVTTYSYRREWLDQRQDSSRFQRPDGHHNPPMRYRGRDMLSTDTTVGAFQADDAVLRQIPAGDELVVEPALASEIRARVSGPIQVAGGGIYLGSNANELRIGDHRITYRVAQPATLSVVGRQTGSGFSAYQTQAGDQLLMAAPGAIWTQDMFRAAQRQNTFITWLIRLAGAAGIFIGFSLILRPLVVVADFVPLIGSILGAGAGLVSLLLTVILAPVVIAIAWFYYRPLIGIGILVAGAIAALAVKMLSRRVAGGTATVPAR